MPSVERLFRHRNIANRAGWSNIPLMTTATSSGAPAEVPAAPRFRITSIDALRGLVMFTMIFVNDLAGAPRELVPDWMVHFSERHPEGASGMTFVDMVFPGFLFIVGMSIPFALGSRPLQGIALGKTIFHILTRTLSLLLIGILMVNESPNTKAMGWSATVWVALLYLSAIFAFCEISPARRPAEGTAPNPLWRWLSWLLRAGGLAMLVWLAFAFRGKHDRHIITLQPFSIHHDWYGILGLIGWAYLVGALVFLLFRGHRTALLGCVALLFCFYPADKNGVFDHFWLSRFVDLGGTLGSQAAITVSGILLASILRDPVLAMAARIRFTLLFIAGYAAAALLIPGLYGISKNDATPAWCLWSCAITATFWLVFYLLADVRRVTVLTKPFAIAGQNVLLAYLISEGSESFLNLLHLGDWYDHLVETSLAGACARSAGLGIFILTLTALLNRLGFRLKL